LILIDIEETNIISKFDTILSLNNFFSSIKEINNHSKSIKTTKSETTITNNPISRIMKKKRIKQTTTTSTTTSSTTSTTKANKSKIKSFFGSLWNNFHYDEIHSYGW